MNARCLSACLNTPSILVELKAGNDIGIKDVHVVGDEATSRILSVGMYSGSLYVLHEDDCTPYIKHWNT